MQKVQMSRAKTNDCKNGGKTNLLLQGARSAAQKFQITVDT